MEIVSKTMNVCKKNKCKPCKDYGRLTWQFFKGERTTHPDRQLYQCKKIEDKEVLLNGKTIKVFEVGNNRFYSFVSAKNFKNNLIKVRKGLNRMRTKDTFDSSQVRLGHLVDLGGVKWF